jgi:hypothetical protein
MSPKAELLSPLQCYRNESGQFQRRQDYLSASTLAGVAKFRFPLRPFDGEIFGQQFN